MNDQKLLNTLVKHRSIFLDTSCFIYLLEDHPRYASGATIIFNALSGNKLLAFTSIITVSETLVMPYQKKDNSFLQQYEQVFTQLPNLTVVSPTYKTAHTAARIRANYQFRLIDSYQLALANEYKCKSFITNDKKLKRFEKEMKIIYLSDYL